MSDEFEDISVEAESPVASGGTEAPVAVEGSAEPVGAEVEATQVNLAPADESLKQNSQQVYLEINAPERANSAAPITAAGHAAKEAEQEEKKATAAEHFAEQEKHAAARREWMEREHDFGGVKMSGHDFNKLIDFISSPQMQDKLRERLGKSGMPKEKIDKGMKELQEYAALMKKEQEGGKLTEEEQRRRREIEKSEEYRATLQAATQQAIDNGIPLKASNEAGAITMRTSNEVSIRDAAITSVRSKDNTSNVVVSANKAEMEGFGGGEVARALTTASISSSTGFGDEETAREHFASAPNLSSEFSSKVAAVAKPAPIANDMDAGFGTSANTTVVAQAQTKPKVAVDVSFG